MPSRMLVVLSLTACLMGCGSAETPGGNGTTDGSQRSIGSGFNESFDRSFAASCISSATARGVADEIASEVCNCAVSEINASYSTLEKARMSDDQLSAIMKTCADKVMNRNG